VKKAEAAKKVEQPLSKADAAQTAKPAGPPPQATPTPLPVDVNTPRTAARTFAPPVAGTRPVDTTIVEAPPSLSAAGPSVPTIAALPARVAPPPQPAASRASAPRQIAVSGKVQATRLSKQITPEYPALAKATRVQGLVRFRATIATDGQIKSLVLLGGPPPLVKGATDAVKQWHYQPTIVDGVPVEVVTDIEVAFTL
jgi:protein TonB